MEKRMAVIFELNIWALHIWIYVASHYNQDAYILRLINIGVFIVVMLVTFLFLVYLLFVIPIIVVPRLDGIALFLL